MKSIKSTDKTLSMNRSGTSIRQDDFLYLLSAQGITWDYLGLLGFVYLYNPFLREGFANFNLNRII